MKKITYTAIIAVCLFACGLAFNIPAFAAVDLDTLVVETSSVTSFKGNWYEIGRQIGTTYPEYIIDFGNIMGMVLIFAGPGKGWTALKYYEEIESIIPQSIKDHMQGMADGLVEARSLSPHKAWDLVVTQNIAIELLNMRSNMSDIPLPGEAEVRGCTAFGVASEAGTFLCHNTDANVSGDNINVIMYWEPTNGDYACVTMDPPGWADVDFALNEKGIAVTLNAGGPHDEAQIGMPVNFMLRHVIEHAATLEEAVGYFTDYVDSGKYFGTSGEIIHIMDFNNSTMAKLEVHSNRVQVIDAAPSPHGATCIASANHYSGEVANESSTKRYERLMELINQTETFDLDTCWDILSDTDGGEASNTTISRVGDSVATNFGVILTADGLHYTMGPPHAYRAKFGEPPFVSYSRISHSPVASFIASAKSHTVILNWQTAAEADVSGFNLYRAGAQNKTYEMLNQSLIQPATQTFEDSGLKNRNRYYYKLEIKHGDGTSTMYGPVNVTPKLMQGR